MADKNRTKQTPAAEPRKKADIIIEKLDCLLSSTTEMINSSDKAVASSSYISRQNSEIYERTLEENANLRQQIKYIAAQNQNVFDKVSSMISELSEKVNGLQHALEEASAAKPETTIDYDAVAQAVVARLDLEELASNLAGLIGNGKDGQDETEEKPAALYEAEEIPDGEDGEPYGIDYDLIADKVAERLVHSAVRNGGVDDLSSEGVSEAISADYIASKVAEQIIIPDPDYDMIADAVFDRFYEDSSDEDEDDGLDDGVIEEDYIPNEDELEEFAADEDSLPEYAPLDYEKLANLVVEKLVAADEEYVDQEYEPLDYEKLADLVAERVFRDDGQSEEIEEEETVEFDYDKLAEAIAEKISISEVTEETAEEGEVVEADGEPESVALTEETLAQLVDEISKRVCDFLPSEYDIVIDDEGCAELARKICDKLNPPEIDVKEISESISSAVIYALPAAEVISDNVSEKVVGAINETEYSIVIDEDGVAEISGGVAQKVVSATENRIGEVEEKLAAFEQTAGGRFDKLESDVNDIKNLLENATIAAGEIVAAEAVAEEETSEEPEEELVTVSDVIGEEEEPEEAAEPAETDEVIEEIVSDIDEQPVDGEALPDGMDETSASVDFANMMKYNRSFIARIIQGSDEVKTYYGATKTALLSYKKVNSSVAWGAERFNKGRETIAKFKIRGKTLCLYLALDPNEYKTSVYHQVDVSDNKSMATTPMMVKIKSPLGVKKAIRLIDDMLEKRGAVKQNVVERDYVAMYPYETIEELIEDGLVKDVSKNK